MPKCSMFAVYLLPAGRLSKSLAGLRCSMHVCDVKATVKVMNRTVNKIKNKTCLWSCLRRPSLMLGIILSD